MIISERIFDLLQKQGMSQKEFSEKTGIAQSTISDWKRKKTNPVSEKILIICEVLGVTPYELLGGTTEKGSRSNPSSVLIIDKGSEFGQIMADIASMDTRQRERLLGYIAALKEANNKSKEK
jgi:transcriptional regulator with XRE-family HTH domain